MKKAFMLVAILSLASTAWAGSSRGASDDRLDHAGAVLHDIMAAPDKGIPEEVMEHARCVAVVPHLVKGAFVFGAEGGRGVATCRVEGGKWSAPAFFDISGGSFGFQIGVEGVDLVLIIQNYKGMQRLMSSKFELGGDASVAAGPVGRHAEADTDWKMNAEILTYSRARGVFAGISLNGAVIGRDESSTKAIYGYNVPTRRILQGRIEAPPAAYPFLSAVSAAGGANDMGSASE
jgi:SH3 domain-containing YSC84-like protein 1